MLQDNKLSSYLAQHAYTTTKRPLVVLQFLHLHFNIVLLYETFTLATMLKSMIV